jgi:predicted chitinase
MITEAEALAQRFHETYERLAPSFNYSTRQATAVPWDELPDENKRLMIAVCEVILEELREWKI